MVSHNLGILSTSCLFHLSQFFPWVFLFGKLYRYISMCFLFRCFQPKNFSSQCVRTGQIQRLRGRPSSLGAVEAELWGRRGAHGDLQKGHEGGAAAQRRAWAKSKDVEDVESENRDWENLGLK